MVLYWEKNNVVSYLSKQLVVLHGGQNRGSARGGEASAPVPQSHTVGQIVEVPGVPTAAVGDVADRAGWTGEKKDSHVTLSSDICILQ